MDGDSLEDAYIATPGAPDLPADRAGDAVAPRNSGGTQNSVGFFLQDVISLNNLVLTLSARVDNWQNYDGHIIETIVSTGAPGPGNRPDAGRPRRHRCQPARRGALPHLGPGVGVGRFRLGLPRADAERALSSVRVGLVRTLANEDLGPERLFGGEAGVRLEATRNLSVRSTWYDNTVKNPVSNVTIGTNLQQRQNLGRTRIRGWQNDVEMRITPSLRVTAGYLFNIAKVTEFDANPALVGLYLPQVPKHRGSVGRVLLQSSLRHGGRNRHVLRPPVRRRPEHAHQAG